MRFVGRDHIVARLVALQHEPHRFDVFFRVTPIPLRVEIAEVELLLQALLDAGCGPRDLAGYESLAPPRRLVVEEDAVAGEQVVRFAIIHRLVKGVDLGAGVGAAGIEGGGLGLRDFPHGPEHFARRRLVDANRLALVELARRFEHGKRSFGTTSTVYIGSSNETRTWLWAAKL